MIWAADPGRRWRVRVDQCVGPWLSLGLHVDLGTPLIDLHVGWWLISAGRLYGK
jgi:hypothetical protein